LHVHETDGRPGRDHGTGWTQDAKLRIGTAKLLKSPTVPSWILDGSIEVGERMFDNLLPIPFDHQGSVVVKLSGAEGELHATGVGASLTLLGEPVFVEDVPADDES